MNPENKIVTYLLLTALMVLTFICATAISNNYFPGLAWSALLLINLGVLVYISRK